MNTLNQVVQKVREIAEAQGQVKHFFYGHPLDWYDELQKDRGSYPSVCLSIGNARMGNGLLVFDFTLWIAEMATVEVEGHSDTVQIMGDIFSDLDHPEIDWYLQSQELSIEPFDEDDNENLVTGCKANISIGVQFVKDRCAIPGGYESGGDITINSMAVRSHTHTSVGGASETVVSLIGKRVFFATRDGVGQHVITSGSPAVNQLLWTSSTGVFGTHADNPIMSGETIISLYTAA